MLIYVDFIYLCSTKNIQTLLWEFKTHLFKEEFIEKISLYAKDGLCQIFKQTIV